jgi:hypothetical protein
VAKRVRTWDSGSRRSASHALRDRQIRAHGRRLDRVEQWLRKRHGTRWPRRYISWMREEREAYIAHLEQLYDQEFEPWFPIELINKVEDATALAREDAAFEPFLEALWQATSRLNNSRSKARRGIPTLDKGQRRRLQTLYRSIHGVLKACGPYDEDVGALLRKYTFNQISGPDLLQALAALGSQVNLRLHQAPLRPSHKPKATAVNRFYEDVVVALDVFRAAEFGAVRDDSPNQSLATTAHDIAAILLKGLGDRERKDPKRPIAAAISRLHSIRASRKRLEVLIERSVRRKGSAGEITGKACP